jgi:predicted 3-demethylubiquinone-9 3-methyltransferase (glyoxalase superfamily)
MTIAFELKGQQFVALNGGPGFPFTNAVSLVVNCDSQQLPAINRRGAGERAKRQRYRELLHLG